MISIEPVSVEGRMQLFVSAKAPDGAIFGLRIPLERALPAKEFNFAVENAVSGCIRALALHEMFPAVRDDARLAWLAAAEAAYMQEQAAWKDELNLSLARQPEAPVLPLSAELAAELKRRYDNRPWKRYRRRAQEIAQENGLMLR